MVNNLPRLWKALGPVSSTAPNKQTDKQIHITYKSWTLGLVSLWMLGAAKKSRLKITFNCSYFKIENTEK